MAPETLGVSGGDIDSPLIDVWSLGIVLLCVAMKPLRPLKRRLTPVQISKMLAEAERQGQGEDSGWLNMGAIQAMLQVEQSQRLSAGAILRRLQAICAPPDHADQPLVPGTNDIYDESEDLYSR